MCKTILPASGGCLLGKTGSSRINWESPGKFGNSHIVFNKTDGKAVMLPSGMNKDAKVSSLTFWVYPQSSNFHLFSLDGIAPELSISLRNQRPLFSMSGLNQQSLPGTSGDEFWASGFLPLNKWSHLALSYSLENRRVRFYINGVFDSEGSFANSQIFPLAQAFRLGPQDGNESSVTEGKIDDFRVYQIELTSSDISRIYGSGKGDFYNRTIEFSYDSTLQIPKPVTIRFLEDGQPVELNATGNGEFTSADISVSNTTDANPSPVLQSAGVYLVELTPSDPNSTLPMTVSITGSGVSTNLFEQTFPDASEGVPHNIQAPVINSPALSRWAVGQPGSFSFKTEHGISLSDSNTTPGWLDFNSTTGVLSGTPTDSNNTVITLSVTNPYSTVSQSHLVEIYDPNAFSAKMDILPVGALSGEDPNNLPGLTLQLDASQLSEANGTTLVLWPDSSGAGHPLDRVRGDPVVSLSPELSNKKVVRFNGFSQLYSSFDFGSLLSEYTILAFIRHTGDQNQTVVGSVGTDWVFGMGEGRSSYWKMGSVLTQSSPADENWHLFAGTLSSNGDAVLWRDQVKVFEQNMTVISNSKPQFLALGGSQTNEKFSNSEVAEILLYDRVLSYTELNNIQNYLRVKWTGGTIENFPMLVRLSYANHPGFDLNTFSDSTAGGDLRFYDQNHTELIYEVDEWNASGESLVWVSVPSLSPSSKIIAYWGNDANTSVPSYRTDGSLWSGFDGVWHLEDTNDSSANSRTATGNGGISTGVSSLVGKGSSLDGVDDDFSVNGYNGITGGNARTISLWVKSSQTSGGFMGWGTSGDFWNFGWNPTGPQVQIGGGAVEQGLFNLSDDQWHHLAVSFPGTSSDLNETKLFVDGNIVDAPASSQVEQ